MLNHFFVGLTLPTMHLASINHINTLNILLRSEIPSSMCAKLCTVAESNNWDHASQSLLLLLACATHTVYIVVLCAYPTRGESHNQRNATGEVAKTSPPFYNEPHRSHILCVKAEFGTTSTSWSQHHFVAIRNPERRVSKALHRGSTVPSIYIVVLHAHPICDESHNQCNAIGEVATLYIQLYTQSKRLLLTVKHCSLYNINIALSSGGLQSKWPLVFHSVPLPLA